MGELSISVYVVAAAFFVVAAAYSSVGMGGGSSYTALLALFGVTHVAIPTISLTLNVLATSVSSFNFVRKGHARPRLIFAFVVTSIPMSYLGGSLQVPREVFYWILLVTLVLVAARIYLWDEVSLKLNLGRAGQLGLSLLVGAVLGLIAGMVGIGGGVYLVPLIIILGLGNEKEAAAAGAIFVFVNSITGLAARMQHNPVELSGLAVLVVAVLAGSLAGSWLGSSRFSPTTMRRILGLIIVAAILSLLHKLFLA